MPNVGTFNVLAMIIHLKICGSEPLWGVGRVPAVNSTHQCPSVFKIGSPYQVGGSRDVLMTSDRSH